MKRVSRFLPPTAVKPMQSPLSNSFRIAGACQRWLSSQEADAECVKTKSLPSQWHKLRLRLCYITSFPHRRGIPAEFLSKLHLSGISTTKLHTQQERACCGTGDRNIRRGATLTLDPVDHLIRPVTFMRVRGSGYRSDGSKVKV